MIIEQSITHELFEVKHDLLNESLSILRDLFILLSIILSIISVLQGNELSEGFFTLLDIFYGHDFLSYFNYIVEDIIHRIGHILFGKNELIFHFFELLL